MKRPRMRLSGTVLGAPDPRALAEFYGALLGWPIAVDEGDWVMLRNPAGPPALAFQLEESHVPPTWPSQPGEQQMMLHLDIGVPDLAQGVQWASGLGARVADFQAQPDVRVMLDPAGHPFCLFLDDQLGA